MSFDPFADAIPSGDPEKSPNSANGTLHYAGFWIRFIASVIDSVLIMLVIAPVIRFFFANRQSVSTQVFDGKNISSYNFEAMYGLSPLGQLAYFLLVLTVVMLFWIYRAATPGKILLGLKIVDAKTAQPLNKQQGIVRYLGYYLSTLFFGLGFIWAAFDRRKQAWHDKIAGTLVIYNNQKTKNPDYPAFFSKRSS